MSAGATVSAGVAECRGGDSLSTLLSAADGALYEAKRSGRNRVIAANDNPVEPAPAPQRRSLRG